MELNERIENSLAIFKENITHVRIIDLDARELKVVELAKMYASDSEAWLKKNDPVTAFSSIEYAHGLLDAILKTRKVGDKNEDAE